MRTRDLLNAFVRQLEARGIDPVAYLRATGISGAELEQRFREEARQQIGRELLLEAVADQLAIEVTRRRDPGAICARTARATRTSKSSWRRAAPTASDRDLRLRKAVDRIAAEVKPISQELAKARESIWTPGQGRRRHGGEETVDTRHKE